MIQLQDISKTFSTATQTTSVLSNINLDIPNNQILGIIGQSGAGKSSLVRILNLLDTPSAGSLHINGVAVSYRDHHALQAARRQIGTVFQHFFLLNTKTVFQNVALPLHIQGRPTDEIKTRVHELLQLVGLSDKAQHYPEQLSGGQKQRVAIARALSTHPTLLLCDEATSALDPQNTQSILQLLKTIQENLKISVVMVTHEMQVVKRICHHVVVIDQGKIVESQNVVDLFTYPKTDATRNLITTDGMTHLPAQYKARLSDTPKPDHAPVMRLWFKGEHAEQPVITELIRQFNVTINIIEGNIEAVAHTFIGHLVIELWGSEADIQAAQGFLQKYVMRVETLAYVARS